MSESPSYTISPWLSCYHLCPDAILRLFCFPHGGGGPQVYRDWADLLPETIEVYSISLPGRGSRLQEPLITHMDDMVSSLAEALRDHLDKAFAFFGHSVGALVCFEVARKLHMAGLPVPLRVFVSAHTAPHLVDDGQDMHMLPDDELVEIVRRLALVPDYALDNAELIDLMLPPLKADFAVSETYQYREEPPLPFPIAVFGGHHDDIVTEEDLGAWKQHTSASFTLTIFDGGHFYTQTHQGELLGIIADTLETDLESLPLSVLYGAEEPYPSGKCLHELFREQAAKTPDSVAVVDIDNQLTFRELDAKTDLLAQYLQDKGVVVDSIVGIYMESCVQYVVAYIGILKAGGAYMPLETEYPEELLARVLESAGPVVVLTNSKIFDRLPDEWKIPERSFRMDWGWEETPLSQPLPPLDEGRQKPTPDSLAYCVMTSGTTGTPKGIICPHRGAVNSYTWRYRHYPYREGEREACNIFFVWEVIRSILQGYPSYVIPDDVIYDPSRLVDFLSEHRITRVLFTPSLLEQTLNTPDLDLEGMLRHLGIVWLNGEVVPTALRNRFFERFPGVKLLNDYSISECHDVCTHDLEHLDPRVSPKYAPLGHPMANVRIYLLDDQLRPVPRGMLGEVYVGGDSLARGYLNEPKKTAERFIQDPLTKDGSLIFRTGDLGRILPNGELEVVGRIQFMVKLRGYSVVLGAVETAIAEHPAVNTAVVLTEDSETTGQPEYLVAYVVGIGSIPEGELERELRSYLKRKLPLYAVPSYFIPIPELPLHDVTGKLDRKKLPKVADVLSTVKRTPSLAPPKTQLEKSIASIWKEVLNVDVGDVNYNFFDLGGHSLLAIQMCTKLSKSLGLTVSVIDVFEHPTIQLLARFVAGKLDKAHEEAAIIETTTEPTVVPAAVVQSTEVAVIGMACRFPEADDAAMFWKNLRDGVRSIREFTEEELRQQGIPPEIYTDENYVRAGGVLENVDQFDPDFWGISRREALFMDPQHRLFLECCWGALERAGYAPRQNGRRMGVYAGCYLPSYLLHCLKGGGLMDPTDPSMFHLTEIGNDKDYLPTRVSYLLNLRGPSISVQTSCSTAAVAVATAYQALLARQCDMAIAGASSITIPQAGYQYVEGHVNSRDGHVRAFDAEASGTVLGDGVGVVVLKRLEDAQADRDNILAVIKGAAVNNDGNAKAGYSAPSVQGQAEVVSEALRMAGVSAETISFVEGHGTGTLIGDPIEVRALTEVFRRYTDRRGFCALGSVKPNIGHSNIAAGMAGLIKTILALKHRQIPPTINFNTPNPEMRLDESPFYINDSALYWESPQGQPRRAGVSCFGIGGTNCHIILEEAPAKSQQPKTLRPHHVLTLSAKTPDSLEQSRLKLIQHLKSSPATDLGDIAYTLHMGREHFPHRLAVSCHGNRSAVSALEAWQPLEPRSMDEHGLGVVFMFPGQGSQYLQMGYGLYQTESTFQQYFDQCCELLEPLIRADLRSMVFAPEETEGAAEIFQRAYILQPSLFALEYALARTLMDWGIRPDAMAGHSIGEYVAACLAGIMSLKDALMLVVTRSYAIEEAPAGTMLSVRMSAEDAREFLKSSSGLVLAVVNSPTDVVLAGAAEAVERAEVRLQDSGVVCRRVHVTRAFHSPMMNEAAETLTAKAMDISLYKPEIPVVSNLTGDWMPDHKAMDTHYWGEHLQHTVRFADNVRRILDEKPAVILEVGPGRTLGTLVSRFTRSLSLGEFPPVVLSCLPHPLDKERTDPEFFSQTLGRLWALRMDVDWHAYHSGDNHLRIPLPTYSFERQRCWWDGGHDRGLTQKPAPDPKHGEKLPLEDRFFIPSWARSLAPVGKEVGPNRPDEREQSDRWLVLLDSSGQSGALGELLVDALEKEGHEVLRVYRSHFPSDVKPNGCYSVKPEEPEEYFALLRGLYAEGKEPARILYLWSLQEDEEFTTHQSFDSYYHFLYLAKALIAQHISDPLMIWIISNKTVQVGQEETLPAKSTILGPCFAFPQENPHVNCRFIDVQLSDDGAETAELARQILAECTAPEPDAEPLIALRGCNRWVQRYEPVRLAAPVKQGGRIRKNGVYLITGGLGRIGLLLAEYLARHQCKLVLTDVVDFPERKQWPELASRPDAEPNVRETVSKLLSLEEGGVEVLVLRTDVTKLDEMKRLIARTAKRFGAVHGIFHAAGVAHLEYLPELTDDISQLEFQPKIYGLLNLEEAIRELAETTGKKPEFVVLFSSLASILGGLGMAAYTAANRFMDAFAQTNTVRNGVSWICINWDDWDFKYTKEQTAVYEKTMAKFAISPHEGLEALERILGHPGATQVLVSTRPMQPRMEQWLHQKNLFQAEDGLETHVPDGAHIPASGAEQATARGVERVANSTTQWDDLERQVAAVYEQVLGVATLSPDDNFFDLGGDSLLASQILLRLQRKIPEAKTTPLRCIFNCPTVRCLAAWMRENAPTS